MSDRQRELVRYSAMCSAIEAAHKVDEVKAIRDKTVALEHYARQAKNVEAERQACEIRLRAERKAGELLRGAEKNRGTRGQLNGRDASGGGVKRPPENTAPQTLLDLGISKSQSSAWQKLAAVPQREFNLALKEAEKPTTNGILRATSEPKRNAVAPEALWLWGRLRDFERDGLIEATPSEVLSTMTDEMLDDVHRLAPRVAGWLKRIGEV